MATKGLPPSKARSIKSGGKNPVQLAAARKLAKAKNAVGVDKELQDRPMGPSYQNPKKVGFLPGQYHN